MLQKKLKKDYISIYWGKVELCSMINLEVARMAHENLRELEDQLIELRQTYQEVISETREFEDPQLQNGPINAAEVRLSALRHEIAEVEKKIKKAESKTE